MNTNEKRPEALRELRGAENEKSVFRIWLAFSRRQVNEIRIAGLLFRLLPVAGLGLAGGWAERLVIWCPLMDLTAKLLRSLMEARV